MARDKMTPVREQEYRQKLAEALTAGAAILKARGSGLDAVEAAIKVMEDSPLFNAGKGAVFTADGTIELDAAIMDGEFQRAGAVTGLGHVRNPITLARIVMEKSPHVMMAGAGAEALAWQAGLQPVEQAYFFSQGRWDDLQRVKSQEGAKATKSGKGADAQSGKGAAAPYARRLNYADLPVNRFGTVGAVALDRQGNLAAGTSTGGKTNKKAGRVGDSPIIGAGTYAKNATCAISATGDGEFFIRTVVAHDVSSMMEYQGKPLHDAAVMALAKVKALGGEGGLIGIDKQGHITTAFNSAGMFRAYLGPDGNAVVRIFKDEDERQLK